MDNLYNLIPIKLQNPFNSDLFEWYTKKHPLVDLIIKSQHVYQLVFFEERISSSF